MKVKNQGVCTGTASTGLEGIKQCENITIRGNRVRAGHVPMLDLMGSGQYLAQVWGCPWTRRDDVGGCRRVQ